MPDQEEMTKSRLLELIQFERKRLETTLSGFGRDQMAIPVDGGWTALDIVAHITTWESRMTHWLKAALRGEAPRMLPDGLTSDDVDLVNEQIYIENRDKPLDEVLSAFHASCPQALEALEAVPEEDLLNPNRAAWQSGEPLWYVVAANTCWHYAEHEPALRAWLEKS
jgi:hypothetical protein